MAQRRAILYTDSEEPHTPPDGVEIVATIVEQRPDPRATLARALDRIAAGDADTLLLRRLRTAAGSLGELVWLLEWLEDAGADLIALDLELDTGQREGSRAVAVLREVEGWDRDTARIPRGRPGLAHGRPELAERIAALRESGLSLHSIARELNDAGIPTPRGGREWRASSVQSALGYRRPRPPAPGAPPPRLPPRPGEPPAGPRPPRPGPPPPPPPPPGRARRPKP